MLPLSDGAVAVSIALPIATANLPVGPRPKPLLIRSLSSYLAHPSMTATCETPDESRPVRREPATALQEATGGAAGPRLIDDFGSLQEAEAFADRMREIDAGRSCISPVPQQREMDDPRTYDLIDRNHVLIAAATKARSDVTATLLKAEQMREQVRITETGLAIFQWRKE